MPTLTQSMILGVEDYALNATVTAPSADWTTPQNVVYPRHDSGAIPTDFDSANGARVLVLDLGEAKSFDSVYVRGLKIAAGTAVPTDLTWQVRAADDAAITSNVVTSGSLTYVKRATGGASARLGMPQPNLGPTDAQLAGVMNAGRLDGLYVRDLGSEWTKRYVEVSFTNGNASEPTDALYVPKIAIFWGRIAVNWRSLNPSTIRLPGGATLRKWDLSFEAMDEAEIHRKLAPALQVGKRAFLAIAPEDRPEYFLASGAGGGGEAAMVEIVSASIQNTGNPAVLSSINQFRHIVSLTCVERFNGENEA